MDKTINHNLGKLAKLPGSVASADVIIVVEANSEARSMSQHYPGRWIWVEQTTRDC